MLSSKTLGLYFEAIALKASRLTLQVRQNSWAQAISFNRTTNTAGEKYVGFEAHYPFFVSEIEAANFKANAS